MRASHLRFTIELQLNTEMPNLAGLGTKPFCTAKGDISIMAKFNNLATSQTAQPTQTSAHAYTPDSFFKLTATIAEEVRAAKLTAAEWNFWSYLVTLDPFGDRGVEFNPATVIVQLGMSKSTYFSAKAKFQRLGWFDFKDGNTIVRNCRGLKSPELRELFRSSSPKFRSQVQDPGFEPESEEFSRSPNPKFRSETPKFRSPVRNFGVESEISEFCELDSPPQVASRTSQTYSDLDQTDPEKKERDEKLKYLEDNDPSQISLSDSSGHGGDKPLNPGEDSEKTDQSKQRETIVKTLQHPSDDHASGSKQRLNTTEWTQFSAPGAEPEFFEFVVRRTNKLPKPPADPLCAAEGWIRKQGHILYPQYLEWKAKQERAAKRLQARPAEPEAPTTPEPEEITPEQWVKRYQQMWQAGPGIQPYICQAIAQHPERGVRIGAEGPELLKQTKGKT